MVVQSLRTPEYAGQTTQCRIQEYRNFQRHHCENQTSRILYRVILSVLDPRKCEYLKDYSLDFEHAYMTTYLAS